MSETESSNMNRGCHDGGNGAPVNTRTTDTDLDRTPLPHTVTGWKRAEHSDQGQTTHLSTRGVRAVAHTKRVQDAADTAQAARIQHAPHAALSRRGHHRGAHTVAHATRVQAARGAARAVAVQAGVGPPGGVGHWVRHVDAAAAEASGGENALVAAAGARHVSGARAGPACT